MTTNSTPAAAPTESVYERIAGLHITPQARADRFLRRIAGRDLHRPLYIVTAAETGERRLCDGSALAYTSKFLDVAVRGYLERLGFWSGKGHAIVFVAVLPFEEFLAVAIHELAHVIADAPAPDDIFWTYTEESEGIPGELLRYAQVHDYSDPPGDDPTRPWKGHEAPWIRIALHLLGRAALLGFCPNIGLAKIAGEPYGLSDGRLYGQALGDEPLAWLASGKPLRDLSTTPPPKAFQNLWAADTDLWKPPATP